jgi:hypothetical protein
MSSAGPGLAVLVGALVIGCGGGSVASIPPVAPVVAPSPDNDLMQEMGGDTEPAATPAGDETTDEPEPEKPEAAAEPAKPEAKPVDKPAAKPAAKPPAKPAPKQP